MFTRCIRFNSKSHLSKLEFSCLKITPQSLTAMSLLNFRVKRCRGRWSNQQMRLNKSNHRWHSARRGAHPPRRSPYFKIWVTSMKIAIRARRALRNRCSKEFRRRKRVSVQKRSKSPKHRPKSQPQITRNTLQSPNSSTTIWSIRPIILSWITPHSITPKIFLWVVKPRWLPSSQPQILTPNYSKTEFKCLR